MGWWPFSGDSRADAVRSGTAIPNRQERNLCWTARDAYFACLDAHSILDATKDASAAQRSCPKESETFERDCAAAWVEYFKKWRVADVQKKRRLEELRRQGAVEMEVTTGFAPSSSPSSSSSSAASASEKAGGMAKGKEDIQDMLDRKRVASVSKAN